MDISVSWFDIKKNKAILTKNMALNNLGYGYEPSTMIHQLLMYLNIIRHPGLRGAHHLGYGFYLVVIFIVFSQFGFYEMNFHLGAHA